MTEKLPVEDGVNSPEAVTPEPLYVPPDGLLPVSWVAAEPAQKVISCPALTEGAELTETVTLSEEAQPRLSVTLSTKFAVEGGVAVGVNVLVELNAGLAFQLTK